VSTAGVPDDDARLGWWVSQVTRRWAAAGLPTRRRLDLFARLLTRLTLARTATGNHTTITSTDPTAFADSTARDWVPDSSKSAAPRHSHRHSS